MIPLKKLLLFFYEINLLLSCRLIKVYPQNTYQPKREKKLWHWKIICEYLDCLFVNVVCSKLAELNPPSSF
jgi:hypothetical protein